MADLFRGITLVSGGIATGLALSGAWLYYQRRRDPDDPWYGEARLDYIALIRLGIAILTMGMTMVVATRLGTGDLTFRSPIGLVAFTMLNIGMWGVLRDDQTILDGRRDDDDRWRRENRRRVE
jgi:nitrate reductase gamma subunit